MTPSKRMLCVLTVLWGTMPSFTETQGPAATNMTNHSIQLTTSEYARSIQEIVNMLRQGRRMDARTLARELLAAEIVWRGEHIATDAWLLGPVAGSEPNPAYLVPALEGLAEELSKGTKAGSGARETRSEVLARIAARQGISSGGEVASLRIRAPTFEEQIQSIGDWIRKKIERIVDKILDWLDHLRPVRRKEETGASSAINIAVISGITVLIGALLLLTIHSWRQRAHDDFQSENQSLGTSTRDEDPLSRETNEWEQLARRLAAAGRCREAVRAWYHAVLVLLFTTGRLRHQKGSTNWEYVAQIPPEPKWRGSFVEMTRGFDRAWYGRAPGDEELLQDYARLAHALLAGVRREAGST